jgi:bacteriochlorophyll 4-vinyl reductase
MGKRLHVEETMAHREDSVIVNAVVRQALVAAEEVMGENGLNAILRASGLERFVGNFPPDDLEPGVKTSEYARFNEAIEEFYGRGGPGILKRIGRASFRYAIDEQATLMGLAGIAIKALPKKQRIKFILNSLANALEKSNPHVEAWSGEKAGKIIYAEKTCAMCFGRESDRPICHLYVGTLSEAVKWATGEDYQVRETACIAMGDPYCQFEVGEPR